MRKEAVKKHFELIGTILEELGDQCKVVFTGLLLESAWKYCRMGNDTYSHTVSPMEVVSECKDDFALASYFLHSCHTHTHPFL
jgi:hypothetical protein